MVTNVCLIAHVVTTVASKPTLIDPREFSTEDMNNASETQKYITQKIKHNMKTPQQKFDKPVSAAQEIG